ncbi:UDP-glycosyltransferase 85C1-like [Cynara cardunculus var. scolymus]|uniref:UDP-glycosyltransferase 85C1-like n=1 Tax=Cynara cardunculus var. scolymus TaxID=59895 RepID=UPI000D623B0D|nr:UDP-glycosyltransferase 85C1-like [Cynara cardunculus var. scolymus]
MDSGAIINQKKPHVVFIPYPAQSHIKCMLKLARLLHQKGLNITFINTQSNHKRLLKSGGTFHWLDAAPGFQFKTVPDGLPDSNSDHEVDPHTQTIAELWSYLATNFFDSFLDLVAGLETPVTCIVSDGFMTYTNMLYAAEKLRVPIIIFWTLAACGFMGFYQLKILMEKGLVPLKDESYLTNDYLEMEINWIPGMEGIRLKDLPEFTRSTKPNDPGFKFLLETAQVADKASHMIIHSFEQLEFNLIKELKSTFPNLYTIGPLQLLLNQMTEKETKKSSYNGYSLWEEEPECVQWLDSKEPNSVVYVNFGSIAVMCLQDLLEFGWGLVNSGHEFLWIIRTDLVDGKPAVLPQELEVAIKRKGFVASWCSQEEVLNHRSVGGFLTHGGWGSIIESLSAGVPMVCWPVSGDQPTNCRQMCKEWEVGMEIERNVKRDEVKTHVRMLMAGEEGDRMRKKAMEWKKMAETAAGSGGSSSLEIDKLADEIKKLSRN